MRLPYKVFQANEGSRDCGAFFLDVVGAFRPQDVILKQTGAAKSDVTIIGDRIDSDILMANLAGINSIMVLTGVSTEADLKETDYQPTWVMPDIRAVTQALRGMPM